MTFENHFQRRTLRKIAGAVLILFATVFLIAATSGNIQWTQLASGSRHGTGTRGQSSDNTGTSGNCAKFDASGNVTDAGAACGIASSGNATSINGASVPASAAVLGSNGSSQLISATAANVYGLWSGSCGSTTYLSGSGACSTPAGTGGGMVQISQTSLASPAASVTFSAISGSYSQLLLVIAAASSNAAQTDNVVLQFNADTGNNYDYVNAANYQAGTTPAGGQGSGTSGVIGLVSGTTCGTGYCFGIITASLPHYSTNLPTGASQKIQSTWTVNFGGSGSSLATGWAAVGWASPNAVTQIKVFLSSGANFVTGSQITLYGLL